MHPGSWSWGRGVIQMGITGVLERRRAKQMSEIEHNNQTTGSTVTRKQWVDVVQDVAPNGGAQSANNMTENNGPL